MPSCSALGILINRERVSYLHISSAGDPFNTIPYRHVYLVHRLSGVLQGQVDQLEDRYLGMVEASGSNPDLSIIMHFINSKILDFSTAKAIFKPIAGEQNGL